MNGFNTFNSGICNEDQFSTPIVGPDGTVYVSYENDQFQGAPNFRNQYLVVRSTNGGKTFTTPVQAVFPLYDGFNDYPMNVDGSQTLSNSQFRMNSAGNLVVDPTSGPGPSSTRLYISFSDNRNGGLTGDYRTVTTNVDVFVSRSDNGGSTWTSPLPALPAALSQNDQFYPWSAVDTSGVLRVSFMDRSYDPSNIQYGYTLTSSTNHGSFFTSTRVDTGLSNPNDSRFFTNVGQTNGKTKFIGDYNGLAIGPDGVSPNLDRYADERLSEPAFGQRPRHPDIVTTTA